MREVLVIFQALATIQPINTIYYIIDAMMQKSDMESFMQTYRHTA